MTHKFAESQFCELQPIGFQKYAKKDAIFYRSQLLPLQMKILALPMLMLMNKAI
jgi:hypothetical protein